jgi:uncharacterized protein YukE
MTPGITTTPTTTITSAYGTTTPTPTSNTINYVQQPISSQVMLISNCTGNADVNSYIQYAIQYANAGDINNVLSNLQNAISTQSDLGNDAVVQLLTISNTFFTNYNTNANSKTITVWNQGKSMLLGAQQILSVIASAFSYDYGGNLQAAVFALNPIQKDTTTAMNYLNNAISVQTANGNIDAAGFLRQAVLFLRSTDQTPLNNSMTPIQVALYEIASALANLNITYGVKASTVCSNATAPPIPTKTPIPTMAIDSSGNSWWKSQFHMNVPQVIQNFLDARSIYNDSVNNLNIYLQEKGNYDSVITSLQNVQNELNNL